jgi:hypothetical protein
MLLKLHLCRVNSSRSLFSLPFRHRAVLSFDFISRLHHSRSEHTTTRDLVTCPVLNPVPVELSNDQFQSVPVPVVNLASLIDSHSDQSGTAAETVKLEFGSCHSHILNDQRMSDLD